MRTILIAVFILSFFYPFSVIAYEDVSTSSAENIVYELAYPGILPTSPFYSIKMIRDRIIGYLISDPMKRAEFSLLQADKRLQAGVSLLIKDRSQSVLAVSTISKGENYFAEAIDETLNAKMQKNETFDMRVKLSVAARKHEEILVSVVSSIPKSERANYARELGRVRENIKKTKILMVH